MRGLPAESVVDDFIFLQTKNFYEEVHNVLKAFRENGCGLEFAVEVPTNE